MVRFVPWFGVSCLLVAPILVSCSSAGSGSEDGDWGAGGTAGEGGGTAGGGGIGGSAGTGGSGAVGGTSGSGGGAGDLESGCDWLDSSANCWRTIAGSLEDCLPAAAQIGVLDGERTGCAFPGGQVVEFPAPLPDPIPADYRWAFGIARTEDAPEFCFHLTDYRLSDGRHVDIDAGPVSSSVVKDDEGLKILCNDTASWAENHDVLDGCPDAVPAYQAEISADGFEVSLDGVGRVPVPLFRCSFE